MWEIDDRVDFFAAQKDMSDPLRSLNWPRKKDWAKWHKMQGGMDITECKKSIYWALMVCSQEMKRRLAVSQPRNADPYTYLVTVSPKGCSVE